MFVRIIKPAFVNGALRHPGQVVKLKPGQKPSKKSMVVLESVEGVKVAPDPERDRSKGGSKTKKEVIMELDAAGIAYEPGATKSELESLLKEALDLTGGTAVPARDLTAAPVDDDSVI